MAVSHRSPFVMDDLLGGRHCEYNHRRDSHGRISAGRCTCRSAVHAVCLLSSAAESARLRKTIWGDAIFEGIDHVPTNVLACLVASAAALAPAERVAANGAEAFVGGLLGGAIGNADRQPAAAAAGRRRSAGYVQAAPGARSTGYQREENRRVQTALNYFGFPAGVADGVLGATRAPRSASTRRSSATRRPAR